MYMLNDDLTICVLTNDEQDKLQRCLSSVQGVGAELVVVDSGKSQATATIAEENGAQYFEFDWEDSFSKARNFAVKNATNDNYLFYLIVMNGGLKKINKVILISLNVILNEYDLYTSKRNSALFKSLYQTKSTDD
uniref:CAZy families GT2 protein n=1 Tax=uncultured Desulfatibacillum sp. TaxID=501916 RepID=A0A060CG93_9BACT|nr:CAZy families GT2 protein [uncultured Desulfatibacillum sp.]